MKVATKKHGLLFPQVELPDPQHFVLIQQADLLIQQTVRVAHNGGLAMAIVPEPKPFGP